MKHILSTTMFLFSLCLLHCQDIIVKTSGDEIQAKVTEVNINYIKYYKFGFSDGPVYTIDKNLVFMIKYANGTKDVFQKTTTAPQSENNNQAATNYSPAQAAVPSISNVPNKPKNDYDTYMAEAKKKQKAGRQGLGWGMGFFLPAAVACFTASAIISANPNYGYDYVTGQYDINESQSTVGWLLAWGITSSVFSVSGIIFGSIDLHKAKVLRKKAEDSKAASLSFNPSLQNTTLRASSKPIPELGVHISF